MNRLKEIIQSYSFAIYPVLFGLFPLLSFYSANTAEIAAGGFELSRFLVFNLVVAALCWAIAAVLTRDKEKSGILAVVMIILFFMFGRLHDALGDVAIKTPFIVFGPSKILIIISVFVVAAAWFWLRRTSAKTAKKVSSTLLLVGTVLVLSTLVTLSVSMLGREKKSSSVQETEQNKTAISSGNTTARPDIYYLLLDGYTREDMLKTKFGYDNSGFTSALRDRGFYVADKANSNYAHTHFSVPSTFNMKYLNYLVDQVGERSSDRTPLRELTQNHEVAKTFKSLGYKYVQIGSQWGWTLQKSPQADIEIKSTDEADKKILGIPLDEFALVYLQTTALKPWVSNDIRGGLVARTQGAFERTAKVPAVKEPTLTFTHVVSPHPPYLFDRNGVIPNQTPLELDNHGFSDRKKFVDQTVYINQVVLQLVDTILKESETPPIIVIASDHGSAAGLNSRDLVDIDPKKLNEEGIRERMGILNTYYFPDKDYSQLYPNITPVNTFRVILNQYFQQSLERLPDRSYFSGNKGDNEYRLHEVTEIVNPKPSSN